MACLTKHCLCQLKNAQRARDSRVVQSARGGFKQGPAQETPEEGDSRTPQEPEEGEGEQLENGGAGKQGGRGRGGAGGPSKKS